MIICFQFDLIFFIYFKLHLIGRKVNLQAVILKRIKIRQEVFSDFFVRFLRSIWGVCPTRRGVSHETQANHANLCALSSIASEARFINLERQGHGSGRSSRPDGPYHRIDRPRRLKINQGRRKPSFQSPFASQTTPPLTDQVTTSLRSSTAVSASLLGEALGRRQPTQEIPRTIASCPTLAKRVCRWPRRSGEEALRRSPRWLPTGVS